MKNINWDERKVVAAVTARDMSALVRGPIDLLTHCSPFFFLNLCPKPKYFIPLFLPVIFSSTAFFIMNRKIPEFLHTRSFEKWTGNDIKVKSINWDSGKSWQRLRHEKCKNVLVCGDQFKTIVLSLCLISSIRLAPGSNYFISVFLAFLFSLVSLWS